MKSKIYKTTKLILILCLFLSTGAFFTFAQGLTAIEKKQQEIEKLEATIQDQKTEITQRQQENFSYENHLKTLEINLAKNQAEQKLYKDNIDLTKLEIADMENKIDKEEDSLEHQKKILGSYLRDIQHFDETNKMMLLLNSSNLSEFYNRVNFTENISDKTFDMTQKIISSKEELEADHDILVNKRLEQESLLANLYIYEKEFSRAQNELKIMKEQNQEEITSLEDAMASTEQIQNERKQELFALTREGQSIEFQEAAKYAQFASAKSGVRPELIMAIVKQETNFGNNVGNGNYKTDMKPDQHETFVKICLELGRSPENTPVSARPKSYSGWGGAMGIAQFMPKTWLTVSQEVGKVTGSSPADPWKPLDAFTAVGLKLRGMGAASGSYEKEWEAAGRYFAGGNFKRFPWYADNVMDRADKYKDMIQSSGL